MADCSESTIKIEPKTGDCPMIKDSIKPKFANCSEMPGKIVL